MEQAPVRPPWREVIGPIVGTTLFFVLAPGTFGFYRPLADHPLAPGAPAPRPVGACARSERCWPSWGLIGLAESFSRFAIHGRGTPAPVMPPKRLVVTRALSVRPEPDVRRRPLDRRGPGPALRQPAALAYAAPRLGHGPSLDAGVRRAQLCAHASATTTPPTPRPCGAGGRASAPVARVKKRPQRSIKLRKSGTDGVGLVRTAPSPPRTPPSSRPPRGSGRP